MNEYSVHAVQTDWRIDILAVLTDWLIDWLIERLIWRIGRVCIYRLVNVVWPKLASWNWRPFWRMHIHLMTWYKMRLGPNKKTMMTNRPNEPRHDKTNKMSVRPVILLVLSCRGSNDFRKESEIRSSEGLQIPVRGCYGIKTCELAFSVNSLLPSCGDSKLPWPFKFSVVYFDEHQHYAD